MLVLWLLLRRQKKVSLEHRLVLVLQVTLGLVGVPFEEEVRPNPSRIAEQLPAKE